MSTFLKFLSRCAALLGLALSTSAFVPLTLFDLKVAVDVRYDKLSQRFQYTYSLENKAGSKQDVNLFGVAYDPPVPAPVEAPPNWTHLESILGDNVLVWYYNRVGSALSPGARQPGFSIYSKGMPAPCNWYAQSSYRYFAASRAEAEGIAAKGLDFFFNNSKLGSTVGPGPSPPADPAKALVLLRETQERVYNQKWFGPVGIHRSLQAKLDAAERSFQRGSAKAASNNLRAYINELNALDGKKIGGTTAALLRANAEYLVDLLSS